MYVSTAGRNNLLVMIAALYITQGLPLGLAFQAFPVLLRAGDTSLEQLSLLPLVGLPWAFKFLWASTVENYWSSVLGRRKSWVLSMQMVLACCLVGMAFLPFIPSNVRLLLGLVTVASLASATLDIAIDGLAAEHLHGTDLAYINAFQVGGFMLGMLVGGPGVVISIGVVGHVVTFLTLSILVLLCSLLVVLWREPALPQDTKMSAASLRDFFRRKHALRMLALGMLAVLSGSLTFGLARLILVDAAWVPDTVTSLSGVGQSLAVLVGSGLAVWCIKRMGEWNCLILGAALVAVSSTAWCLIALVPTNATPVLVLPLVATSGMGIGIVTVPSYTVLMQFTRLGKQPGTDFSIFQGTQTLGEIAGMSVGTAIAAWAGYPTALLIAIVSALATIVVAKFNALSTRIASSA